MSSKNGKGQIYTLEGFVAAVILIGLMIYIAQSISLVSPQTEMTTSMKLQQKSADTLICLDRLNETNSSELKAAIAGWNGAQANHTCVVQPTEASIKTLDSKLRMYLTPDANYSDVRYNLEVFYFNSTGKHNATLIEHGQPGDNSVSGSRLITVNYGDGTGAAWSTGYLPQVVEVRLVSWYI